MRKKRFSAEWMILVIILAVFVLSAAGIVFGIRNYIPPEPDPGTGVPGEKAEYRENAIAFVRENEDLLFKVMEETRKISRSSIIDLSRFVGLETYDEPVLRLGFERVVENDFLKSVLEDTILESVQPGGDYWSFALDYSSGIVTSSIYYDILYCEEDPAPHIYPYFGHDWQPCGNGRLRSPEADDVDFYLEEIGNGFWYSYISWP